MPDFVIRRMQEHEVQIAIDWAQKEGWNPGLYDAHSFYQADPNGFFIGLLNAIPIVVGSAVIYDAHFAFCGLYIVKKEYRKLGYGLKLTQERLKYVGNRITGIDGVVENLTKYQRIGYVPCYKQIRYEWQEKPAIYQESQEIVDVKALPFELLCVFDRKFFPAPRSQFLQTWISQPDSYTLVYIDKQQIRGYGVIRKCAIGYKIGPLFAESSKITEQLLLAFRNKVGRVPIFIDMLEINPYSQELAKKYHMLSKFEVIRMYRNGIPTLPTNEIFGVTTFELG